MCWWLVRVLVGIKFNFVRKFHLKNKCLYFTGKVIVLKQNNNITDEWLHAIGMHRPVSLTISQCHGDKVTATGLRDLFRNCSDSLEVLALVHCFIAIFYFIFSYFCTLCGCRKMSIPLHPSRNSHLDLRNLVSRTLEIPFWEIPLDFPWHS